MKIVDFPGNDISDIPRGLRALADSIEAKGFGDAHHVAWVIDEGGTIAFGMLGKCAEPGAVAHFLFALGQRELEKAAKLQRHK